MPIIRPGSQLMKATKPMKKRVIFAITLTILSLLNKLPPEFIPLFISLASVQLTTAYRRITIIHNAVGVISSHKAALVRPVILC